MSKSTQKNRSRKGANIKPPKPYKDFPLTPHNGGAWMKKINGKIYYFGRWGKVVNGSMVRMPEDGWKEALEVYKAQKDDLYAGRKPRMKPDGLTVGDLYGRFLTIKSRALDAGEITAPTYREYRVTADRVKATFGENRLAEDLDADDFENLRADLAKFLGPVRLTNEITRVKAMFKYGFEAGLIDRQVRFGPSFKKPTAGVLRRHRAKNGKRMIEAKELSRIFDALDGKKVETGRTDEKTHKPEKVTIKANPYLRAMFLLGVNCGFNNKDCADLPLSALDLDGGWINFPRPKTGIERRCPLWPETVSALRKAIAECPEPKVKEAKPLVFVTTRGRPYLSRGQANPISQAARDLLKAVGVHRKGLGFATLRHVFETVAGGSRDQVAVNHIMGHADGTMAATYRERIEDERLLAVSECVHKWLFGNTVK